MTFTTPWLALAAVLAALAVLALHAVVEQRRTHALGRLGGAAAIARLIPDGSTPRRWFKAGLRALAVALVLVAIAGPRAMRERAVTIQGLDLVIAVDVSKSMLVTDVPPSRLVQARAMAVALIRALPGDRIAPEVFAGTASQFPLTDDHEVAIQFIQDLGPTDLAPGSNLDEALRVGRCLLRPDLDAKLECSKHTGRRGHGGDPLPGTRAKASPPPPAPAATDDAQVIEERGRAMVVFTDGAERSEALLNEVRYAHELGIAVVFVGLGTAEGGLVYDIDGDGARTLPEKGPDGRTIVSRRDDEGLQQLAVASKTERYIPASPDGRDDPAAIVAALEQVSRGTSSKTVRQLRTVYQPFAFVAFMLLVIEALIATRRRPREGGP